MASTGPTIAEWQQQIEEWLDELLDDWTPAVGRQAKVIRDPVHGFVRLHPHEAAILDTPILQRLRYISQNGLARLVYPGLNHSRLDHSLGVLHTADLMMDVLSYQTPVDPKVRLQVRLAALLHDVGHVLFSHMGEALLSETFRSQIKAIRSEEYEGDARFFHKRGGKDTPGGEILSFLIIRSSNFGSLLSDEILARCPSVEGVQLNTLNLDVSARLIIGKDQPGFPRWAADLISGGFDADKLDYLMRDCHYSGVKAEVDTSRLIHSLLIVPDGHGEWSQRLSMAGVSINYLEQIFLAKLTLYVAIYHHHKIRAIERMFRGIFDVLPTANGETKYARLESPRSIGDLLRMSEFDFWSLGARTPEVCETVRALLDRNLLKRSLTFDRVTVKASSWGRLANLRSDLREPDEWNRLRQEIYDAIPSSHQHGINNLWLDFPRTPDVDEEAHETLVQLSDSEVRPMSDLILSIDDWLKTYATNKARGHLFYVGDRAARESAADVTSRLIRDQYNIELDHLATAGIK